MCHEGETSCTSHLRGYQPLDIPEEKRCKVINRTTGERCKKAVIKGARVCNNPFHGGRIPNVLAQAKKNVSLGIATKAMAAYGRPVKDMDPFEALLEEIARTAGHVRWLEAVVQGMDENSLIWSKVEEEKSIGEDAKGTYDVTKHAAVPHIWLQLYHKERAHLLQVCKVSIQCGIQERTVRLAEQQGEIIVKILQKTFNDPELGLSPEQVANAKHVAGNHLRIIAGGEN